MLKHRNNIVSAIEIGTSKITVLIGCSGEEDGELEVIGHSSVPSGGSVVKGEIFNMEEAFIRLNEALEEADRSSGGAFGNSSCTMVNVTGSGIDTYHGVGTVTVKSPDQRVREEDCIEAGDNARIHPIPPDRQIISSSESYFVIDGQRRMRNPVNQIAHTLDSHVQIIRGQANRVDNFRSIVLDVGVDEQLVLPIFSGSAADVGILSEDEKNNGVLLVDFGAGTTEYMVEYNAGMIAGGMVQIGFEHLLNDLSVGLNLPMDYCRKLAQSGDLERIFTERPMFVEYPAGKGEMRKIPLNSFETIVDLRLRELFEIIQGRLKQESALTDLNAGGVLTGGGALFSRSRELFRDVFGMSVRIGQPLNVIGASGEIANPRYSMVYGALKIADHHLRTCLQSGRRPGGLNQVFKWIDLAFNRGYQVAKGFKGSFKI